ncbi:MAG: hypothetical protein ACD_47C00502G0002 [uncultured bacterium]|nr:MAG: hypothetical protein ACD_47C00502G0002 [uncultured bacterium]HBC75913.1 hypothetical protein [Candidatus Wallbacteria bacterium]
MPLVCALNIEQWASTIEARYNIGELIRHLIYEGLSYTSIKNIRFLSGETTQSTGWDGILECDSSVSFIPDGLSVWEIGTGEDAREKIKSDFYKRKDAEIPSNWSRQNATYIAVTPRRLNDLISLENELKNGSPWKDVKIYDAAILEGWIQYFPTAQTWLQEKGVGLPPTVSTLTNFWNIWSYETVPPVSIELLLAGRQKMALEILDNIKNSFNLKIKSDSPEETVAFIYSLIKSQENSGFSKQFLSKTLIINKIEDIEIFKKIDINHNFILLPPVTEKANILINKGHSVINAISYSSPVSSSKIDFHLKRSLRSEFVEALLTMKISKDKAETEASACGASTSIWRIWNKRNIDITNLPEWAKETNANLIITATLLGAWNENSEDDKTIVKEMSGMEYENFRDNINKFLRMDNPPLIKIDNTWLVAAPSTAFALIVNHINRSHLEKLKIITNKVFSEIDPALELPLDERHFTSTKNIKIKYSTWLRDGLAETLLRIVVLGEALEEDSKIPDNQSRQNFVNQLIKELPGLKEDYRLIVSLRDQLPILAEAAPYPFIEALEFLLQGSRNNILPLFDEGDSFYGQSYLSNILWSLETLAWEPDYFPRVSLILVGLSAIDPGGKTGNRPLNSLREIFLAWHQGTNANLDMRSQVIDLIIKNYPDVGWQILKSLMPQPQQISHGTRKPEWKDFGRSATEKTTRLSMTKSYELYIDKILLNAGTLATRWNDLIDIYSNVSENHQKLIVDGLKSLIKKPLCDKEKYEIWKKLRVLINKHKSFNNAVWAMKKESIDMLEEVILIYSPDNIIDQISWLFDSHHPDISFPIYNHEDSENELKKLRSEAIKKIFDEQNTDKIFELINKVSYPYLIVPHLLEVVSELYLIFNIFKRANEGTNNEIQFARTLSDKLYNIYKDEWLKILNSAYFTSVTCVDSKVNAVISFPDSLKTYEIVKSLGNNAENKFWSIKFSIIYSDDENVIKYALEKLCLAGRYVDVICNLHEKIKNFGTKKVIEIIDLSLEELNKGKPDLNMSDYGYHIKQLVKWLRKQEDIDKTEVAKREYAFLPLFTSYGMEENLTLHELMTSDPEFFVEVLCDLFKPSDENNDDFEPSETQQQRAKFAWDLLRTWKIIPGLDKHGNINNDDLKKWVETSLKLADQKKRLKHAYNYIGQIFYYSPIDLTDNVWPSIEIRELIEELKNDDLERGIEIEQFNSRGVVTKNMFEGGEQEKELAKKWHDFEKNINVKWLRTKKMLGRIADSWEREAKREDIDAEKQKIIYG